MSQECRACQSELSGHSREICVAFDGGSFEQEEEIECNSIILQTQISFCLSEIHPDIPYICHFFTRAKFLENKIYTEKRQFFAFNQ